jgi:BirA family biotin operon repressor/biotin-[acetyl-CoA-carboxylase] ligase
VVVVAEEQTAGRGRMGRTWVSPAGRNLTASIGLAPELDAADGWQLGLAAALAARDACGTVADVELKWPNDLVAADGRKIGGLLVETSTEGSRLRTAVIGFGININWRRAEMPGQLADGATSLAELAGRSLDRVELLRALLDRLESELAAIESGRSPLERYRAACATLGAEVTVDTPDGRIAGRARDLDERGALVVETAAGPVAISSGQVLRVRREAGS